MKTINQLLLPILLFSFFQIKAQNVGVGVTNPTEALTVDRGIKLDNNNENSGIDLTNGLRFGNTISPSQMVGISSNRTGISPYSLDFYTFNTRRMVIAGNGLVGINTYPTSYYLEVGGTVKGNTIRSAGSVIAEGGSVSSSTSINAGTSMTAQTTITAVNNITTSSGDIVATSGDLFAGGKGVVMSNTSSRQRIVTYTATLSVGGLAAGASVTGTISISANTFTGTPTAYVGNVVTENGDFYKAMIVLENVTTSSITVRVVNVTSSPISFTNAAWKILAIGNY